MQGFMKSIFFALTVVSQFILVASLKILDNLHIVALIFAVCMTVGFFLMYLDNTINITLKSLGWGLRYGTLFSIIATMAFLYWLSYQL
jgi:amino acid transporter